MSAKRLLAAGVFWLLGTAGSLAAQPNSIDYSMFFLSDVRDSKECAVTVGDDGRIDYGAGVTNPAMTCPDAFAWSTFIHAISESFWEDWTTDTQMWPSAPLPRCTGDGKPCCERLEQSNDPAPVNCPVFPGATPGMPAHSPHPPTKAHQLSMEEAVGGDGLGEWDDVQDVLKTAVIGNEQAELVYRNLPMVRYVFDNNLYHADGLAQVYDNYRSSVLAYAPYRPEPAYPTSPEPQPLVKIDLPTRAIMVKVNWLERDLAEDLGIHVEQNAPYIVMDLPPSPGAEPKPFLLLSFHISTKDIPNWFWATFEHVDNQGRCDWTGCNDSFGYLTRDPAKLPSPTADLAPPARNYTAPHQADDVDSSGVQAFAIARSYSGVDAISGSLAQLLEHFDIGTAGSPGKGRPTPQDPAWHSYRLKGSQIDFVTPTGRPTQLGNSVTEAGFTNSASCISCHSRAGADERGLPPLAIFTDDLSDAGLPKSVNGIPDEAWFDVNAYFGVGGGQAPGIRAIQTDFVWGFRNACPLEEREEQPSRCVALSD